MTHSGQTYENSRQHGKYIGLDECNQYLQTRHEDRKQHGDDCHGSTQNST